MDIQELEALQARGESDRMDLKAAVGDGRKIRETICAFANDLPDHRQPGVLLVGINNDGTSAGLPITEVLLRKLSEMRSDGGVTPFPRMEVCKERLRACEVAAVVVYPSDFPPVRYDGRTYVRVGPTTRQATLEEERRLTEKRRARDLPFDMRPVSSASVEDMDIARFVQEYLPASIPPDVLESNMRDEQAQLASMRFLTPDGIPTVAGLLVVGKDPRAFVPGAYVQFVRFAGTTLTDAIKDQRVIDGPLPDLLSTLDETLKAHISTATDIRSQFREILRPDYPIVALQQFLRNAVMHRTYEGTNSPVRFNWFSDRVEILSPGGPYGQVTLENFGKPGITDYRNPQIAEAMKNLGYVQRFGVGIQLARQELEKNGNPPAGFNVEMTNILVTVWART